MAGQLCLRWNNHATSFNKLLSNIYLEDIYADGTILCQGQFYPVHSFVLSTCSEYFEEMFRQCSHLKNRHPFIIVKDIHPGQMEALLSYMYKGEVNVPQEMLPELIKAAEIFKIKGLAVPDEEPSPKHSRKRSNISSPSSVPKKSRRYEEKSPTVSRNKTEFNDIKHTESVDNNSDDNDPTSELFQNINKSTDEVDKNKIMIPKIKEEISEKQETIFILDDNEDTAAFPVKQEQNLESFQEDEENYEPFNYDASNDTFDEVKESGSWDHSHPFEGGEGSDTSHTLTNGDWFGSNCANIVDCERPGDASSANVYQSSINVCHFLNCTYNTPNSGHMKYHIRKHTGEKPFKCPHCDYRAVQKTNINRHVKTVHSRIRPGLGSIN